MLALDYLRERCARVLCVTIPLDLGRPRVGAKVSEANRAVARQSMRVGALLLDLHDLAGRELVMFDHVHPTAMGQIAIAERALDVLIADGVSAPSRPRAFAAPQRSLRARARAACAYAYRSLKQALRIRAAAAQTRLAAAARQPR